MNYELGLAAVLALFAIFARAAVAPLDRPLAEQGFAEAHPAARLATIAAFRLWRLTTLGLTRLRTTRSDVGLPLSLSSMSITFNINKNRRNKRK